MNVDIRPDVNQYAKLVQHGVGLVAGQLEVTSACNQRCPQCFSRREHLSGKTRGNWELQDAQSLMRRLAEIPTFEHLTLTGGDPQSWAPLDTFLEWWRTTQPGRFHLQMTTALVKPMTPALNELWRNVFYEVRVSLDAVSKALYKKMRGIELDPQVILERIAMLNHPRTAVIMTVTPDNLAEVHRMIGALRKLPRIRKVIFLPVQCVELPSSFWTEWEALVFQYADLVDVPNSFGESAVSPPDCPCYIGRGFFHIKANGDYYPCCRVGGEAIPTDERFLLGNVHEEDIEALRLKFVPQLYYANGSLPCSEICQYKQIHINNAVWQAEQTWLAMP